MILLSGPGGLVAAQECAELFDVPATSFMDYSLIAPQNRAKRLSRSGASEVPVLEQASLRDGDVLKALRKSDAVFAFGGDRSREALVTQVRGFDIIAAIPRTATQVRQTYGEDLDSATAGVMAGWARSVARKLSHVPRITMPRGGREPISEYILKSVERAAPGYAVVVIAHSADGVLRFPDKSAVSVERLQRQFVKADRPGLLLSCSTLDHVKAVHGAIGTIVPLDLVPLSQALTTVMAPGGPQPFLKRLAGLGVRTQSADTPSGQERRVPNRLGDLLLAVLDQYNREQVVPEDGENLGLGISASPARRFSVASGTSGGRLVVVQGLPLPPDDEEGVSE